ncbi:hypothetical protein [Spirosoma luteum]|uniref:hypothetical protein n=1 Tax=Spirosoma luteum TaxID=431553 RepID=UPI00036EE2A2|nr:hypothetical protein [Spirosoma luteum]
MRGNVLLRTGLLLLIILPVGFLLLTPPLMRCLWISRSVTYRPLAGVKDAYTHQAVTTRQENQLRQHVATARNRIVWFWGDRRGQATLIYCPNQSEYEQFCDGGEGAGCSLGLPWGDSYLILGPDGNNADVIAHELCHDELFARLGWWRVKRQIPQWFNEGLALLVDYRFSKPALWDTPRRPGKRPPTESNSSPFTTRQMIKLSELETTRDFFGGDYGHTMLAYQTAASEVAHWLSVVGKAGIPALMDAVAKGDNFSDAYRQLERQRTEK